MIYRLNYGIKKEEAEMPARQLKKGCGAMLSLMLEHEEARLIF